MEGLKRTKEEFFDSQPPSFTSPFYKETKIEGNRAPGQNYFNFCNAATIEEEEMSQTDARKPSRSERQQKIEKARENFSVFLRSINAQLKSDEFYTRREILLAKMKVSQEIPNIGNVNAVHKEYLAAEKTRKNYKNKNWNDHEIKLLLFMVVVYNCTLNLSDKNFENEIWSKISLIFTNKNGQTCKFKLNSLLRSHPTVLSWTPDEDELLKQIIMEIKEEERNRIKWAEIAIKLNKLANNNNFIRVGKHCRERWHNHLNPDLKKGSWSPEEDLMLLEQSLTIGKKWAKIARNLSGRNENSVKNRFITLTKHIKVKAKSKKSEAIKDAHFIQEIKKIIHSLKASISNDSLNKSMEKLDINTPETSPSPELKSSPLKHPTFDIFRKPKDQQNNQSRRPSGNMVDDSQFYKRTSLEEQLFKRPSFEESQFFKKPSTEETQSFKRPSWPKENIADFTQTFTNTPHEIMQNFMLSNYNNYLLYMQFLNSRVMSPHPQLEKQYQEIQKELKSVSQKDLCLSHLHFSTTSSENDRRGSGFTSMGDPGSKRPSNSYTSLYLTPSVVSTAENDESSLIKPVKVSMDIETSTNPDSNKNNSNNGNVSFNNVPNFINTNPQKPQKNKNKTLMALVVDEITEVKETPTNSNNTEENYMANSWNKALPTPTPPIINFSNVSPLPFNSFGQDYFLFSPANGVDKRGFTPIQNGCKVEQEEPSFGNGIGTIKQE